MPENVSPMTPDELAALDTRRANGNLWWKLTTEEIARAYAAGARNFRGANLEGANLGGAYLEGANLGGAYLRGANLLNSPGIYVAYAPNLSSRNAALLGGIVLEDGEVQLRFWAGCQQGVTPEHLRRRVARTHGEGNAANIYAKQYEAAITFIEAVFEADMAAGKWEYLKTWEADRAQAEPAASEI